MPAPELPLFRRRAGEPARLRKKPIADIARDLGISESCLRRWVSMADVDDGTEPGLITDERAELVRLRRDNPVLEMEMEMEILMRTSACFAQVNVLPECRSGWSLNRPLTGSPSRWPVGCWAGPHRGSASGATGPQRPSGR